MHAVTFSMFLVLGLALRLSRSCLSMLPGNLCRVGTCVGSRAWNFSVAFSFSVPCFCRKDESSWFAGDGVPSQLQADGNSQRERTRSVPGRAQRTMAQPSTSSRDSRQSPTEFVQTMRFVNACTTVKQLEKAVDALDKKDPVAASLCVELQKARSEARPAPVADRIQSTTAFIERARKREGVAMKELKAAQEEIRDGEARLERRGSPGCISTSSFRGRRVGTSAAFSGGIDPKQFRQKVGHFHGSRQICTFRSSCRIERRVGSVATGARRIAKTPDDIVRRKHSRTLATPSLDLVPRKLIVVSPSTTTAMDLACSKMESLIQHGDQHFQFANRFDDLH